MALSSTTSNRSDEATSAGVAPGVHALGQRHHHFEPEGRAGARLAGHADLAA